VIIMMECKDAQLAVPRGVYASGPQLNGSREKVVMR